MFRLLVLTVTLAVVLAYDPHLKIAEKIAIPHHIRHGYDYPYINIAEMMNRNGRQGFSQSFPADRPQSQVGFSQPIAPSPSRGFQGGFEGGFQRQPFQQTQFRNAPAQQTRFFRLGDGARSAGSFSNRFS